jgi:hypothetical protein
MRDAAPLSVMSARPPLFPTATPLNRSPSIGATRRVPPWSMVVVAQALRCWAMLKKASLDSSVPPLTVHIEPGPRMMTSAKLRSDPVGVPLGADVNDAWSVNIVAPSSTCTRPCVVPPGVP